MNIVHIYRSMGQGGAQKVILQLCKAQVNDGNRVWVISSGGFYEEDLREMGVTHISIPDIASKNPIDILKCMRIIRKASKEIKTGIVHTHHRSAAFDVQIACRGLKNIHLLYTSHNVFSGKCRMLRFALHKTHVVAVGEDVKKNLVDYYGVPEKQVTVICNSVEKPDYNNKNALYERQEGAIYVGFIGRLTQVKGVDVLIKAFAKIEESRKNIKLFIIGDGEKAKEYKRLVEELELETVQFTGYRKDAMSLIASFDFIVLPSWQEGFPLTIIESFAYGKPVIATNIPGNNELVSEGKNGLLISPGDFEELSNKIIELCNSPSEIKRMGENALSDYKEKYSYDAFIERYRIVYKKAGESQ